MKRRARLRLRQRRTRRRCLWLASHTFSAVRMPLRCKDCHKNNGEEEEEEKEEEEEEEEDAKNEV